MLRGLRYSCDEEDLAIAQSYTDAKEFADPHDLITFLELESPALRAVFELLDIPWTLSARADETMARIYEDQWADHEVWDLWILVEIGLVTAELGGMEIVLRATEELVRVEASLRSPEFLSWKLAYDRLLATAYAHFSRYGKMHPASIIESGKLKTDLDAFTLEVLSSLVLRSTPFVPTVEPPGNLPVTEEEVYESRMDLLSLKEFADTELVLQDPEFLKHVWLRFKLGESADDVAAEIAAANDPDIDVKAILTDLIIWRTSLSTWPSMEADY